LEIVNEEMFGDWWIAVERTGVIDPAAGIDFRFWRDGKRSLENSYAVALLNRELE
jgi:hypothetical protein